MLIACCLGHHRICTSGIAHRQRRQDKSYSTFHHVPQSRTLSRATHPPEYHACQCLEVAHSGSKQAISTPYLSIALSRVFGSESFTISHSSIPITCNFKYIRCLRRVLLFVLLKCRTLHSLQIEQSHCNYGHPPLHHHPPVDARGRAAGKRGVRKPGTN